MLNIGLMACLSHLLYPLWTGYIVLKNSLWTNNLANWTGCLLYCCSIVLNIFDELQDVRICMEIIYEAFHEPVCTHPSSHFFVAYSTPATSCISGSEASSCTFCSRHHEPLRICTMIVLMRLSL